MNETVKPSFLLALLCLVLADLAHADTYFISPEKQFKPFGEKTTERKGEGTYARQLVTETSTDPQQPYYIDYYSGRARMDIWGVECGIDKIHGFKWCRSNSGQLALYEDSRGGFALIVGRNHYPQSRVYVRADDGKPVVTEEPGWSGDVARNLARRLSKGRQIPLPLLAMAVPV